MTSSVYQVQSPSVNPFPYPKHEPFEYHGFTFRIVQANARYVEVLRVDTQTSYQACDTLASMTAGLDALCSECPHCRAELIERGLQQFYSKVHGWHYRMLGDCPMCGSTHVMGPRIPIPPPPSAPLSATEQHQQQMVKATGVKTGNPRDAWRAAYQTWATTLRKAG